MTKYPCPKCNTAMEPHGEGEFDCPECGYQEIVGVEVVT
jgi:tRNA(Ile2) C34 agmatinyltransferase TiaS